MSEDWKGVLVALTTPFDDKGNVDEAKLKKHADALVRTGAVGGLVPCGGSGEAVLLSEAEWELTVRAVVEATDGRVPVIAGCSDATTRNTARRMQFAEKTGADGAMVAPPWYVHPDERELLEHFRVLAGESGLKVVLYNTPHSTGVDVKPELVARIAEFGQITHKKTTSGDMTRLAAVERLCGGKVKFLVGCDPLAMEQFLMGATGWITPCGNFIPGLLQELYDLCVSVKDTAKAKQLYFKLLPMFSLFESGLYIQLTKYAMKALGNDYGLPRRPLLEPEDPMKRRMDAVLTSLGLL